MEESDWKNYLLMLHRWAGCKWSRFEQTEFIGGCHTKAVSIAMFWESCVCLFFNTCYSGNQCFIYVGSYELWKYISSYLTFPSPLSQGVKKVHYKKKYQTSSCCWASTFYSSSDVGLILLFTSGKIEIRWWVSLACIFWVFMNNFRMSKES